MIEKTGAYSEFWTGKVLSDQRDTMVTAVAAAVGINATFLLPYSMLAKGWDREFRGLAIFDLGTGLLLPFVLTTGCIVIAAANQFHGEPAEGLVASTHPDQTVSEEEAPAENLLAGYRSLLDARIAEAVGADTFEAMSEGEVKRARRALPEADMTMAATLVRRDAFNLAEAPQPRTSKVVRQDVFGLGVVAMAISTIIVHMIINGFAVCSPSPTPRSSGS